MEVIKAINNLSQTGYYTDLLFKFELRQKIIFFLILGVITISISGLNYYFVCRFEKRTPKTKWFKILLSATLVGIIVIELFSSLVIFNQKKANVLVDHAQQIEKDFPDVIEINFNMYVFVLQLIQTIQQKIISKLNLITLLIKSNHSSTKIYQTIIFLFLKKLIN